MPSPEHIERSTKRLTEHFLLRVYNEDPRYFHEVYLPRVLDQQIDYGYNDTPLPVPSRYTIRGEAVKYIPEYVGAVSYNDPSKEDLEHIIQTVPHIRKLILYLHHELDLSLLRQLPYLTHLRLTYSKNQELPELITLHTLMLLWERGSSRAFTSLEKKFPNLRTLFLRYSPDNLEFLQHLKHLKSFTLLDSDGHLLDIAQCTQLEHLALRVSSAHTTEWSYLFSKLTRLKILDLTNVAGELPLVALMILPRSVSKLFLPISDKNTKLPHALVSRIQKGTLHVEYL